MKLQSFNEFTGLLEKKGVAPAIYKHLKAFFDEHKDGSYADAKEYIKDKADGWDLSKEDYNEMKSMNENVFNMAAKSVDDFVEGKMQDPKFKEAMFDMLSSLTPEQIQKVRDDLKKMGVKADSDAQEILAKAEKVSESRVFEEKVKAENIANVLHDLGALNIASWAGVPAAILIGGLSGAGFAAGLAASWGATAILMGLAKLLGAK